MEIAAQLNAIAPSSDLPAKQAQNAASPRAGHSKKPPSARQMSSQPPDAQQPVTAPKADLEVMTTNTSLRFTVYDENKIAVRVVDKESGDTIREIPSEELRQLAAQMEKMAGNFFEEMA